MRLANISHGRRPGTVTIIVVAFLGLLLIMGLTFAFYGLREAEEARIYRDSANGGQTGVGPTVRSSSGQDQPPEPDAILNVLLSSVIYGPPDDARGAFNVLRNYDLATAMYGHDPVADTLNPLNPTQPYNGPGRVPTTTVHSSLPLALQPHVPVDRVNWSWMTNMLAPYDSQPLYDRHNNWIRDPRTNQPVPIMANYRYYAPNANYTYQDLNNMYLAAVDPTSGRVLIPSYHRPWHSDSGGSFPIVTGSGSSVPAQYTADNNNWTNVQGRMMMLTPRPVDHQWPLGSGISEFQYPIRNSDNTYGHVENLPGKAIGRQYDSLWMDLDLPVSFWRGKAYKPLVAFLIVDLDGRMNLNTAGNYYMAEPTYPLPTPHSSNQGIGPWEVNPEKILTWTGPGPQPATFNDARQVVLGPATGNLFGHHRFGEQQTTVPPVPPVRVPMKPFTLFQNEYLLMQNMPTPGSGAYAYSAVDFDGRYGGGKFSDSSSGRETAIVWGPAYEGNPDPMQMQGPPRPNQNSRFRNGMYIPGIMDERTQHPSMYNPYLVRSNKYMSLNQTPRSLPNRSFGVEEQRHMSLAYNYGSTYFDGDLGKLASATLGKSYYQSMQLNPRWATTVISNDIDQPGSTPWRSAPANLTLNGLPPNQPTAGAPGVINFATPNPSATNAEDFDTASFRAKLTAALGPIDIDRKLTDYRNDASQPYSATNFDGVKEARARGDRQLLAKEIFDRLRFVSTGASPSQPLPGYAQLDPNYNGHRWLAQLAVNIVDYIDTDDYMTPFNWNPTIAAAPADPNGVGQDAAKQGWVFGFERPRLLINEVYGRYENDPNDPGLQNNPRTAAQNPYIAKFWIELHNPVTPANAAEIGIQSDNGSALLYNSTTSASVYRISIVSQQAQTQIDQLDNVLGTITTQGQERELASSSFIAVDGNNMTHDKVAPNQQDQGAQGYSSRPQQINDPTRPPAFFVVATEKNLPDDTSPMNSVQANRTDTNLRYNINVFDPLGANPPTNELAPRILLRRLANPHMPPGQTNPYVTVDYFKMDRLMMNNALEIDNQTPPREPMGMPSNMTAKKIEWRKHHAYGRRQPFAAAKFTEPGQDGGGNANDISPFKQHPNRSADNAANLPVAAGTAGEYINQTFARHNGRGDDWNTAGDTLDRGSDGQPEFQPLVHLDRVLLSPVELLHVAAVRPLHFTHAFTSRYDQMQQKMVCADPVTGRLYYTANWLDDGVGAGGTGLYLWRALEFLKTPTRYEGLGMGGRVPGKININTNLTPQVFAGVCDAQVSNRFSEVGAIPGTVQNAWTLIDGTIRAGAAQRFQTGNDRPIWGLATAVTPAGTSPAGNIVPLDQRQTLVMPNGFWASSAPGNFNEAFTKGGGGSAGTLQKFEMLNKVFNNFTTRSNCFAIYATVGYFEVRNPGPYNEANRPVLGKELGIDEGQVTRHRFFSIVDRTNLTIELPTATGIPVRQGPAPVYLSYQPNTELPWPGNMAPGNNNAAIPDPIYTNEPAPGLQVQLRVPIIGQDALGGLLGHYDGTVWTIRPGLTFLQIDLGDRQELVQVANAQVDTNDSRTGIIIVSVMKPHYRGATMRIVNPDPSLQGTITIPGMPPTVLPTTIPGNPGPQPGFNYKSPRYAPVVKYVEQLK